MKIFINPGHCRTYDSGAVGFGLREADVAYKIALGVEYYLNDADIDTDLYQFDGLAGIVDKANASGADYFVSIHCNASEYHTGHGVETYYCPGSWQGSKLAASVQNQLIKIAGLTNRGVKEIAYYVLKWTDMPAILIETAFIDDFQDNRLLKTRADDFSRLIADGILDFLPKNAP